LGEANILTKVEYFILIQVRSLYR